MNYKKLSIILIIITLITMPGCSKKNQAPVFKTEFMMGTLCSIKIYDKDHSKAMNKAFDRIKEIENEMTINKSGSEVDSINAAAGEKPVKVSLDTYTVIKKGLYYSELSEGKFDITIGPLVKLWGIGTDNAKVPSSLELEGVKKLINYKNIVLDEENKSIMLKDKNMILDLGAIAKGYTADEVAKVLKANGITHAIINLGGNIFVMDKNPNGNKWRIGVQNPFSQRGESVGTIEVSDESIVTSGIYERYFEKDGKHYHHILDSSTGYPYENSIAGISIISKKSVDGDALSTSVFTMGLEDGLKFLKTINDVEGIFITKNKEVYITPGLKGKFKVTDSSFKLKN